MSLARSVGRNTITQIIGKVIGTILGFLTIALIQRSLGPGQFGAYTTVMSFVGFFSVIADLGLYLIVLREIAKPDTDKKKILANALAIRILAALCILAFGIALSFFFPYSADIKAGIALISVSFFFVAVQQVLVSVFQQALRMVPVVVGELLGRVVLLGFVAWFIQQGASLTRILLAVIFGSFINALFVFWRAKKIIPLSLQADFGYWKYLLKETWPIAISIVLNLLYFRLDTIFLSVFRSLEEVGLYGAAYKILEILITFPSMFVGLIMPVLSATAFVESERFRAVFQKAFYALLVAALPLLAGGLILAKPLIVFVGGQEYADAASFFRILMFAVAFLFFGALSGHTVTAIGEQRRMVWAYLSVAIVGVIAYLVLIPPFGAFGAASGNVLAQGSIMIAGFWMIRKRTGVVPSFARFGRIVLSTILMSGVIYAFRNQHILVVSALGVITYGVSALATKAVDMATLKQIFGSSTTGITI